MSHHENRFSEKRERRSASDPSAYIRPDASLITDLDGDEEYNSNHGVRASAPMIPTLQVISEDGDVFIPPEVPPRAMSVGYLYILAPQFSVDTLMEMSEHKEMNLLFLNVLWVAVACGYMVAFTSIGSLIVYFKAQYGAFFYVRLYCAFYLPGWPMAALQRRYDDGFDLRFGSSLAFLLRVGLGMSLQFIVLVMLPFFPKFLSSSDVPNAIIAAMGILGIASWICHGTACQLCGMFPPSSVAFLQTGFCAPQVFTVIMVFALDLDDENAKTRHVNDLYQLTALIVLVGAVSWFSLARSRVALRCFEQKDKELLDLTNRKPKSSRISKLQSPLLNNIDEEIIEEEAIDEVRSHSMLSSSSKSSSKSSHSKKSRRSSKRESEDIDVEDDNNHEGREESDSLILEKEVGKLIRHCRVSIFLNIWCSIFTAAFFVYVPSSHKPVFGQLGGATFESVEVVLYFVRLFSDLLGRPLAGTFRPRFLASRSSLVYIAAFRIALMTLFFLYICACPENLRSDGFIVIVVAVFSVFSGYLSVLSYEYAAQAPSTKQGQAIACSLMNSTFQIACFTAVVMSVIASEIVS